jgi:hypothetical protein
MITLKTIRVGYVGCQAKARLKTETAAFCETVNTNNIKEKSWDQKLQGFSHTSQKVGHKAKGITRIKAGVIRIVSMMIS